MKLVVFAHIPPPHHGQSYMVKLMLDGFGGDARRAPIPQSQSVQCYHVNSRYSESMDDIGEMRCGKFLLVLKYCLEAIWCRIRYGAATLYYVPAPGKRSALYRDWVVFLLCRPFFKRIILHWHAVGLGDWLASEGSLLERWITRLLFARPSASIPLAIASMRDALWFGSRKVTIVPNGIPDPCPDFDTALLPLRHARIEARRRLLCGEPGANAEEAAVFRVLYIAHCTRDKGVFDALEGIALFNQRKDRRGLRAHLTVAGSFLCKEEERAFQKRIAQPDLEGAVTYAGFVKGEEKVALFKTNDALCFPTFYRAEGQPVNLIEAMAFGLAVVTTRWRAIPEILPPDYPGFVDPQQPAQIADVLEWLVVLDAAETLRKRYLEQFSEQSHLEQLRTAILSLVAK
ncbi:MAG: glycosyltransferase family 4 protein [Verrucomicrobiota bacterium]